MVSESSSSTSPAASPAAAAAASFDEEWEDWDGKSPFWHHCVAGSLAGVAEHTLVYPLDTVRTHIQVCAACQFHPSGASTTTSSAASSVASKVIGGSSGNQQPTSLLQKAATSNATKNGTSLQNLGMWQAMRQLMSQPLTLEGVASSSSAASATTAASAAAGDGISATQIAGFTRLWRGVQTMLVGCVPAHALYFSSYEIVKASTLNKQGHVTTYGSVLAGAAAVVSHDIIMGPLDTVKQRLQLGHYRGLNHALSTMIANEGFVSLYRSFPVTLATNIPYGMVMVGINEFCKEQWSASNDGQLTLGVTLASSSLAGLIAAATTTPLDRIKTYLQTQQLRPACLASDMVPPENCPLTQASATTKAAADATAAATAGGSNHKMVTSPIVADWRQATLRIYQTEGAAGFFRGLTPRILSHTPAVAISWTTYETAKEYLKHL